MKKELNVVYQNSLLSFTNSLMNYYNIPTDNNSHALMDYLLSKRYRHIAVVVLDGLGKQIVEEHIDNGGVFKTHQIMQLSSVFPPTTVAATTTLRTGLPPIETGYLGWHLYLKEEDPSIVLFQNKEYLSDKPFDKYQVEDVLPITPWFDSIKRGKHYTIWPKSVKEDGVDTFDEAIDLLEEKLNAAEQNFTYLYWPEPDSTIHEFGVSAPETRRIIRSFEEKITKLKDNLPNNTCVFILADHGLIDVEEINVEDYPEIFGLLRKPFAGESRCCQFYVDKANQEEFANRFNEKFGEEFVLYTQKEFIRSKLIKGIPNDICKTCLGDFVAVAVGNKCFSQKRENKIEFVAHHGGYTKEELMVPVIMLRRKDVEEND